MKINPLQARQQLVCLPKRFYHSTLSIHTRHTHAQRVRAHPPQRADRVRAVAELDTGGQVERIELWLRPGSELIRVDLQFPMGLVFEAVTVGTDDGGSGSGSGDSGSGSSDSGSGSPATAATVVAEVTPGGAADRAGVRPGDVLRATSAAMMRMTYPTAQLMLGGVGRPKLARALVPAAQFAAAMDAVRSNTRLPRGEAGVTLFLERPRSGGAVADTQQQSSADDADEATAAAAAAAVFDSSLFEE